MDQFLKIDFSIIKYPSQETKKPRMAGNHSCFDHNQYLAALDASLLNQIRFRMEGQSPFMTGERVYNVENRKYGIMLSSNDDCYIIDYDSGDREHTKKTTVLIRVR